MKKTPIGIFDSGYGGLSILKEIKKQFPNHDFLYLGDNARAPYGTRSFEVVYEFTLEAVNYLFNEGCPLIILACNTASARALRTIQQNDLPKIDSTKRVLGVIRPSTEIIASYSKTNHIGILATQGTVNSESYPLELLKSNPEIKITQHACNMWVPLIENDKAHSEGGKLLIKEDVLALFEKDSKIDTVLLGCTHYPLVKELVETFVPNNTKVLAQGEIVANSLVDYLKRHPEIDNAISKTKSTVCLTTENALLFDKQASRFLGEKVNSEKVQLA